MSEVIDMLRDSLARYAERAYSFEQRRGFLAAGHSAAAWSDYAEFGWLALRLPDELGGLDADPAGIAALMELVGSRLLLEPLLASAVLGTGLILRAASPAQRLEYLPALADGSLILAFAHQEALHGHGPVSCSLRGGALYGAKPAVLHGDLAQRLIVSARDGQDRVGLYLVDAADRGLRRESYRLLDGRGGANLQFEGALAEPLPAGDAGAHIAEALDEAAVALCSEACGAIGALNAATLQYLQLRRQFGRPIGSNQVLQHRMVEMTMLAQESRALCLAAQRALARPAAERVRLISGARAYIGAAARQIANAAVQMHGGIGVTDELDVSHHYRRLMVSGVLFGDREQHFGRFMRACEEAS